MENTYRKLFGREASGEYPSPRAVKFMRKAFPERGTARPYVWGNVSFTEHLLHVGLQCFDRGHSVIRIFVEKGLGL